MNNNGMHRKKDSARIVWDSKPRRAPNPKDIEFQTAEVVIPNPETAGALPLSFRDKLLGEDLPAALRLAQAGELDLSACEHAQADKQKMNRLIWGDNLLAMQALLNQGYEGKINLIYIDPPFDSKADYSHKIKLGETEFTKEPSVIERLAYKDTWAGGTDSYLDMLYPRLQLMKRLLAPDGSIYVHLDWHVGHYVKVMMDEVFGKENFISEIIWKRTGARSMSKYINPIHDAIYFYARNYDKLRWNGYVTEFSEDYKKRYYRNKDKDGRYFQDTSLIAPGEGYLFDWKGVVKRWRYKREKLEQLEKDGRLIYTNKGVARYKRYLDEMPGVSPQDIWIDIPPVNSQALEDTNYDTQKPSALLERIIKTSSGEGGLVADFFAGSGTALAVTEKFNRRWIGCELGKVGIQVTRGRMVEMKSKPFLVENIGNYQREMIYLGGARIYEMQKIILKLYGAEPMANRRDLGVRKAEDGTLELVYCGYPDRSVAAHKVEDLAVEAATLDGAGYKRLVILAWDYEYNYDELLQTRIKAAGKDLKTEIVSRQIPPDIYEYLKQAKSKEDIERLSEKVKFLEKPYLKLNKPEVKGKSVSIGIEKYVLYDFPLGSGKKADEDREELMRLVKDNFAILIDYWAVDWDYDGLTFKSQWQDLRGLGRKTKVVTTKKEHTYPSTALGTGEKSGPASAKATAGKKHTIAVRVVDIFGNDATATVDIKI